MERLELSGTGWGEDFGEEVKVVLWDRGRCCGYGAHSKSCV